MRYQEPLPVERAEAEAILAADDIGRICQTMVELAFYEPDMAWVQSVCSNLIEAHASPAVRAISATCLGHLARIHRDRAILTALPLLERLAEEPELAGYANDAMGDIKWFIVELPKKEKRRQRRRLTREGA